jgi:hypothetical protein
LGVIGDPAHGIFQVAEEVPGVQELIIARLDQLLSRELRQLLVDPHSLVIPAEDEARFLTDFVPRMRQKITITSADRSVRLPDYIEPILGLVVHFRPEDRVRLDWMVHYDRPAGIETYPIDELAEPQSIRDLAEEQRKLSLLPLPYAEIPQLASPAKDLPQQPVAHVLLDGMAALRFVDQVLPKLEPAGVRIALEGEVREYRETDSQPSVEVAAVERPNSADWFDLHIKVSIDGEVIPFQDLFVALTEDADFLILETGVYFSLDRPEFSQLRELIEESKALQDHRRPELSINRFQISLWDDLTNLGVAIDQSARWEQTVRGLSDISAIEQVAVPKTIWATLRPYQLAGYHWLCFLWSHQLGGVLADDMGLGKTLQALALIAHARLACPEQPPFLVVAPTSVVSNWFSEAARFTPDLNVICVNESESKRGTPWREAIAGADLVITSYALLRIDNDRLRELDWAGVILDEAQFVKNPPGQDLPVRAPNRGAIQAGDYRDSAGEQPDGSLGAALDHRPGTLPRFGSLLGVLPPTDRAQQGCDPTPSAASPDSTGHASSYQRKRCHRAAAQARAGRRSRAAPQTSADLSDAPAARTAEGARPDRGSRSQPVHCAALAHTAAPTEPRCGVGRRSLCRSAGSED